MLDACLGLESKSLILLGGRCYSIGSDSLAADLDIVLMTTKVCTRGGEVSRMMIEGATWNWKCTFVEREARALV